MLRLLGILTLGNMIFGGHRHHYHRRLSRRLGRGILLGTLLGLFVRRANQNPDTGDGQEISCPSPYMNTQKGVRHENALQPPEHPARPNQSL